MPQSSDQAVHRIRLALRLDLMYEVRTLCWIALVRSGSRRGAVVQLHPHFPDNGAVGTSGLDSGLCCHCSQLAPVPGQLVWSWQGAAFKLPSCLGQQGMKKQKAGEGKGESCAFEHGGEGVFLYA